MSAQPWLAETPWPTEQLPRERLTDRIEHFLATHWMGVLCTIGKNGPIGSPVEYYSKGTTVYILPQPNSPKLKAMRRDPRVCFAIHGENVGWASVRGTQIFADVAFIEPGTAEHAEVMKIYHWEKSAVQLDKPLDQVPQITMAKLEPHKVVYTEHWLRKEGYAPRQIWYSDADKQGKTKVYGHD